MERMEDAPSREALAEAKRPLRSLRIALAMFALVLALFTLIAGVYAWNAVYEREQRYMLSLAEVTERSLDAYLQSLETALAGLRREVADSSGQIDAAALASAIRRFKEAYPELGRLLVTRLDGEVLANSNPEVNRQGAALGSFPSFVRSREELLGGRSMSVGQPVMSTFTGDWVIPVRYGARDAKGRVVFLIIIGVPLAKTQSFWKDVPLPERAALSLIHADGYVVSRYPIPAGMPMEEVFRRPVSEQVRAYHAAHSGETSGWFEGYSRINGMLSMVAFQRLSHYPLTVQVINPKANAWSEWWRDTRLMFVLIAVLLAAGAVIYRWAVRRQLAWELERNQRIAELMQAGREMEDFTYTVSHDLRAPLRAVDGYAAILGEEMGSDLPPEQSHALQKIRDSAQRMGLLIDGLLAFSRRSRQPLQKADVDMETMVRSVLAQLVPQAAPGQTRIKLTVGELPSARADGGALRQVWSNLISNALKFGAGGPAPEITIGYARVLRPGRGAEDAEGKETEEGNGKGAYFVRDNGAGFDMAHAKSLFGVFSHTNGAGEYDGSGVGLAMVKRIVERHGGEVWAQSAPGQGATFYFTLGEAAENTPA